MEFARKHGLRTTTLRVKFSVQFDYGELCKVNSHDVLVVNNVPRGTKLGII